MNRTNPDNDEIGEELNVCEPDYIPGDKLDMISSDSYILYSVQHPSTRWIESDVAVELETWL